MRKEEKEEEKSKGEKRKLYQKPALTTEVLFEATVLACAKASYATITCRFHPLRS